MNPDIWCHAVGASNFAVFRLSMWLGTTLRFVSDRYLEGWREMKNDCHGFHLRLFRRTESLPIHLRLSWAISIPTRKRRLKAQESVFITDELSYRKSSANAALLRVQRDGIWQMNTWRSWLIGSIVTLKRYKRSWKKQMAIAPIKRHLFKQEILQWTFTFVTNCNQSHNVVNSFFRAFLRRTC